MSEEPRFHDHRDNGCPEAPLCVECPLESCKLDDPELFHRTKKASRNHTVALALKNGSSVAEVAREFRLTERTVYRIRQGMA